MAIPRKAVFLELTSHAFAFDILWFTIRFEFKTRLFAHPYLIFFILALWKSDEQTFSGLEEVLAR